MLKDRLYENDVDLDPTGQKFVDTLGLEDKTKYFK